MWNNRIVYVTRPDPESPLLECPFYAVAEVFYTDDGRPNGYALIDDLYAETPSELKAMVAHIHKDICEKDDPILVHEDFFHEEP